MAPLSSLASSLLLLTLAAHTSAHFVLNYPASAGFSDDDEATAPCGSFSIDDKTNSTDFHVGGDVISLTSVHPQVTYLFHVTPDMKVAGNFTSLLPAVQQNGLGQFCEPTVAVPAGFAGSKGVLQIVADSPDGVLYQCALLNFVAGAGKGADTPNANCKNATGVSAAFAADSTLSAAATGAPATSATGSSSSSGSMTMSMTMSMSGSTSSSSSKPSSAAMGTRSRLEEAVSVLVFAGIASVAALVSLL